MKEVKGFGLDHRCVFWLQSRWADEKPTLEEYKKYLEARNLRILPDDYRHLIRTWEILKTNGHLFQKKTRE